MCLTAKHCRIVYVRLICGQCVSRICHWEPRLKAEAEVGVLGRGQQLPSPPARGSGKTLWVSQLGLVRSANRPQVFHYFQNSGWPLWRYNIVFCGLSCSHWGQDPGGTLRVSLSGVRECTALDVVWQCIAVCRCYRTWCTVLTWATRPNLWTSTGSGPSASCRSSSVKVTSRGSRVWTSVRCVTDTLLPLRSHRYWHWMALHVLMCR